MTRSGPLIVEPGAGFSPVYSLLDGARHSIDMTMYEFSDTAAEHDLAAAARRGVRVRVILDRRARSVNSYAYSYLRSHRVAVTWSSPDYHYTHQKTVIIDTVSTGPRRRVRVMTVNLVRSGSLYPGVPYAYASVAPRGSLIFTAGACPLDDRGEVVGAGDVRAQASLAVANLATALAESGATLADVLKTTVFVASADRADLVAAWDVVSAAFGEHDAPSTLLGVAVLGYQDQLVEIEAVAVAPG